VFHGLTRRYVEHENGAVNRFRESTAKHEFSTLIGLANVIQMEAAILYAFVDEAINDVIKENVMHRSTHTPAHSIPKSFSIRSPFDTSVQDLPNPDPSQWRE